jgi:exopolysaccharide biosynthesis polyprenyl glycosylphosphotransferase
VTTLRDAPSALRPPAGVLPSRARAAISGRDKVFRRSLLGADVVAALLVAAAADLLFGAVGAGRAGMILPLLVPFVYTASGLYRRDEVVFCTTTLDEAPNVFQAATLTAVLAYFLESVYLRTPLGAQYLALSVVTLATLTLVLRLLARTLARRLTPAERCLIVGDRWAEERLRSQLITARAVKADVVGRQPLDELGLDGGSSRPEALRLLCEAIYASGAQRVVIAAEHAPPEHVHEMVHTARRLGVKVSLLPRVFEVVGSSVAFDYVGGLTLLGMRRFGLSRRARLIKRAFDLVGSAALMVPLAPLLFTIAATIRLTSPGAAVFRQTRVGRNGRAFEMLKFRTMVIDADARKAELLSLNEADGLFKIYDDPRITAVGRLLRRCWLDELPQLVNVLRGDMSLVGPRPLVVDEDEKIVGWHRNRLDLTPGMTGPWQVLGAARIPLREMVTIDYLYVTNWSLWGDIKILLRTVPCVLGRRGQ